MMVDSEDCSPVAWVFAGQGIQYPGMGQDLLRRYPDLVDIADEVLGYSVARLCAGDPERQLDNTVYSGPAVYLVNALAARSRRDETGEQPVVTIGHSTGEFNALEVAGVLEFAEGLRLVAARAEAMARIDGGGMLTVLGLSEEKVREVIDSGFEELDLAAMNSPQNFTLAGPEMEVIQIAPVLLACGARAVRRLQISVPSHSRYMRSAAVEFRGSLNNVTFSVPEIAVFSNVTAEPHNPGSIGSRLVDHLTSPVQWQRSIENCMEMFNPRFVEIGQENILTPIIAHIARTLSQGNLAAA
ncbi:ACP S-malonyltransferase [Streptomyces sp. NPDC015492]|uniref:ACP S-malonyltransferase n=1 Tax=Streptomyces sp. NPDC015492 TaxID=3364958 RepID=UPI0036FBE8DF